MQNKLLDKMVSAYIEAAYRTDTGDTNQPDSDLALAPRQRENAAHDCKAFIEAIGPDALGLYPGSVEGIGYNFWLTRNGHGPFGFQARYYNQIKYTNELALGEYLTNIARTFPTVQMVEGDDGLIYFE